MAEPVDGGAGLVGEQVGAAAGDDEAVAQVGGGVGAAQGLEVVVDGDALDQLAQLGALEEGAQLGLAGQDQLEQMVAADIDVAEQAQLLEGGGVEVLGLVDDQGDAPALGVAGGEPGVEGGVAGWGVAGRRGRCRRRGGPSASGRPCRGGRC